MRLHLIEAREITLELVPGALIDGMVFTVDGMAVEGSIVKLVEPGRNRWGEVPRPLPETISDAAGRFLLMISLASRIFGVSDVFTILADGRWLFS